MIAWSPGARDRAVEGLSVLARREVWRNSDYASRIASKVESALTDANPVVRMQAVQAFTWLHLNSTSAERVDALRTLLLDEPDVGVGTALVACLHREADTSPDAVDSLLAEINDRSAEGRPSGTQDDSGEAELEDDDRSTEEYLNLAVDITTFLGLHHETPYARSALTNWADSAPASKELSHAISSIREYLGPVSETGIQKRAFEFATAACTSALAYLNAKNAALTNMAEATPQEIASLKRAYTVMDATVGQIYFASGAYKPRGSSVEADHAKEEPTTEELLRLADLAIPLLLICVGSKAAPVIHHAVEALVFFSRVDKKRGLQALADAVVANESYAYDSLAAGVVIPHLTRLLAEEREMVLFDEEGVTAFRKILSAFAGSGNEQALVLAFTFADVFR